jgi:hypothetical protein
MILTYSGTAWDESTAKVKSSLSDYSPGYLVAKLEAGMAMSVSEDTTNPADYRAKLDVNLGTLSDQAAAGNDTRFTKVKVSSADTTPGYLDDKIDTAGLYCILATGLTQTIQTPAGNEELRLAINALHPSIGLDVLLNAPKVNAASLDASYIAAANKDGAPATPSMRTLGTLSSQAAAGNDSRLLKINAIVEPGAATTQVVFYYGTGSPPSAAGLPDGTLFFKYTP